MYGVWSIWEYGIGGCEAGKNVGGGCVRRLVVVRVGEVRYGQGFWWRGGRGMEWGGGGEGEGETSQITSNRQLIL
jgi:hypothetical protein